MIIKNRKDQKIAVEVEQAPSTKGLAFIMHGLGGFKEQPHIQAFSEVFQQHGYTVITFDTTNSFGDSDGKYEDATTTNYYEDLEDVIAWAKQQEWYQEPFVLAGHSLGGICTALYAQNHPDEIKALAPLWIVVSGQLSYEAHEEKGDLEEWKKTGWLVRPSKSLPGVMKRLPWSHMEDRLKYDLLKNTDKLTMPVLLMVGDQDTTTPLKHQKILYEALPSKKELHVIQGAEHSIREEKHLEEAKKLLSQWIEKI